MVSSLQPEPPALVRDLAVNQRPRSRHEGLPQSRMRATYRGENSGVLAFRYRHRKYRVVVALISHVAALAEFFSLLRLNRPHQILCLCDRSGYRRQTRNLILNVDGVMKWRFTGSLPRKEADKAESGKNDEPLGCGILQRALWYQFRARSDLSQYFYRKQVKRNDEGIVPACRTICRSMRRWYKMKVAISVC